MLTAETTIQTTNASRYLVQLCEHATKIGHRLRHLHSRMTHARPEVLDVDWSDTHAILTLSWGRCVLDADPAKLTVRVEADGEENLRGVQDLIAADLERFGRREQLSVAWQQVQPDEAGRRSTASAVQRCSMRPNRLTASAMSHVATNTATRT